MKKIVRLTESDLVKIVKRVIEEQITDKGPVLKNDKISISDDIRKKFGTIRFNEIETPETFFYKLNKSNIGVNTFHIESEGYKFPIEPVFANVPFKSGNLRFSFEPFDKKNGKYMIRLVKNI